MSKNKLSILLIKKNIPSELIIKQQEGISHEIIAGNDFYYKNSFTTTPKWVEKFFNGRLECAERLKTTCASGVLLVNRTYEDEARTFAVCFGYGRSLLQPFSIEERFGLITTLNAVNPKELRSLDISKLDANSLKNRIQSSRLAGVADFEFDIEKSLLRQATGISNDEELGKSVSGSDSFSISVESDIDTIGETLDRCYAKYNSTQYRNSFSWIDNILPLKKNELINTLDDLLIEKLQHYDEQQTWLAVPDILNWDDISELKYENGEGHEDILMDTFCQEVLQSHEISVAFLKGHNVHAYDANGDLRYKWSYYKCLYSEIEYGNKLYMLNAGNWYQVDNQYKSQVEDTYNNAPLSSLTLIDYNHDNEGAYNIALVASNASFCLMDKKLIPSGVPGNEIEFCDVYDNSGKLIHIKKYGGSQAIGHLFNQGLVSARMLFDKIFRTEVNNTLPIGWKLPVSGFNPVNYEVVYGIISKKNDERPHIPFFSMVVFHDIYKTLTGVGYTVSLKSIHNAKP